MALFNWCASDPIPRLAPLAELSIQPASHFKELAHVNRISLLEVHARRHSGNQPYIAYWKDHPVGYGWVASREACIGELGLTFNLPHDQRYLWDFAILPEYRQHGVFDRLLQAILDHEAREAECFWIIHAPENLSSGEGIDRAGFKPAGQLSFRLDGGIGLQPFNDLARAEAGAALLGVPLIDSILSPCRFCGGLTVLRCGLEEALACWPPLRPDLTSRCTCAAR
jgi:GNAT superfamily N-acetyltransferase